MSKAYGRLDAARERQRRLHVLLRIVPRLLDLHLKPALGGRRWLFIARMLVLAPLYAGRFNRSTDDAALREVKRTFLLVGVLYNELSKRVGNASALTSTRAFLYDLACAVQRLAYVPDSPAMRSWEHFHREHEAQMVEGFISANENGGVVHAPGSVRLHITRCRFHECFRDMGNAAITEAFCHSDETVFNEVTPVMHFHRGSEHPDTIARGASRCTFVYERLPPHGVSAPGGAGGRSHATAGA